MTAAPNPAWPMRPRPTPGRLDRRRHRDARRGDEPRRRRPRDERGVRQQRRLREQPGQGVLSRSLRGLRRQLDLLGAHSQVRRGHQHLRVRAWPRATACPATSAARTTRASRVARRASLARQVRCATWAAAFNARPTPTAAGPHRAATRRPIRACSACRPWTTAGPINIAAGRRVSPAARRTRTAPRPTPAPASCAT